MSPTDTAELRRLHEAAAFASDEWDDSARDIYNALPALLDELEAAREENDFLRLRLAESDKACVYCNLPASEMPKCASGFPGCARADDLFACDELTRRDRRMKLIGAAEELERLASVNQHRMLDCNDLTERAAQLRREAEDGK